MSEFEPTTPEQSELETQGIALAQEISILRNHASSDKDYQVVLQKITELKTLFGIGSSETKLAGEVAKQIEQAKEIFDHDLTPEQKEKGMTDVLGLDAINKVFGIELESKDIPDIPFSPEELKRAKELGQFLILRTDKIPIDKLSLPNTKKTLENAPETRWALVSKKIISDSTSKDYWQQSKLLALYIKDSIFKDEKTLPKEYQEAITEFDKYTSDNFGSKDDDEINVLLRGSDWAKYAEELSNLKINQLTRQNKDESLYDIETYYQTNNEYLLPDEYTWTSSRDSVGDLVNVGYFDAGGAFVLRYGPGPRYGHLGVSFSRSL